MSLFPIERLPHLVIPQAPNTPERYKRTGFSGPPPQGGERAKVAENFEVAIQRVEEEQQKQAARLPAGIQPHLVFRLPLFEGVNINELEKRLELAGFNVLSIEPDKSTVVAFQSESDLSAFRAAIEVYKTPKAGSKSTVSDIFEWVKASEMRSLQMQDRIGPKLAGLIGSNGENIEDNTLYAALDVELLTPQLNAQEAQKKIAEVRSIVETKDRKSGQVLDTYPGATICQARVRVNGAKLRQLLELPLVETIDFPPQPQINPAHIWGETPDKLDFPTEPINSDGPRLCVLDSGIVSGHPLLAQNVGFVAAFPSSLNPADQNGHGTRVAGIALYGDVRRCVEEKRFQSSITLYSGRILNDDAKLDDEKLFINQIRESLDTFTKAPYECRIYNLSFGRPDAWGQGKQTLWGEALDNLAREYQVLFIVSSGNAPFITTRTSDGWAEEQMGRYHRCLLEDEWRLCDPATSALALTVGAIAELEAPKLEEDIRLAVVKANQPSPFSRSGTGVMKSMKPDFVDNGGNLVFQGTGSSRRIYIDQCVSVVSFHREPTQRLFDFDIGTSMAAPRVAHIAALTEWQLWQDLGERPHPNLVRAVMATAARIPEAAKQLFGSNDVYRACGYGKVNQENAMTSQANRVLLCASSEVELDHITVFRVPIIPEFISAKGEKRITIALAFDPPVRKQRHDYLGVEMGFKLVRGKSLEEVEDAYRKFNAQEKKDGQEHEALEPKFVAKLEPSDDLTKAGVSRKSGTLQCAQWKGTRIDDYDSHGEWYVVVRAENKWAKAEIDKQTFAIAVVIEADSDVLYERIRERVQVRPRVQIRG